MVDSILWAQNCLKFSRWPPKEPNAIIMFNTINSFRIMSALESAAKNAASRNEDMTAHYLGKAEKILAKTMITHASQVRAYIALYERVLAAAQGMKSDTIPIREHCEEMKTRLEEYMSSRI
jgi:hypothetical protein